MGPGHYLKCLGPSSEKKMTQSRNNIVVKEYPRLSLGSKFKFSCHKGIECFSKCCADVNIFLTPYDVLRMKKALNITSEEFLEKYTVPLLLKDPKFPVVALKMTDDEKKSCPFVTEEGCQIYPDRPWSCRMYPLETASSKNKDDAEEFYFIAEEGKPCLGMKEDKEWTVEEWLIDQEVGIYNKKSQPYMEITMQKVFREGKGLGPSKIQMFYIACYDLDRFRRHLFEGRFFHLFDIEEDVIERIKTDDEELLEFGAKWLRFSLFGEKTINIKGEIVEEKQKELDRIRGEI